MSILQRSESRQGTKVIWLGVHSTEGDDNPLADDARALRDADWWEGSSHAIADDEPGTLLTPAEGCVPYDRAAWTLRGGNRYSDNIELVARASWTRAQWLAQPRLLEMCAQWLADRHKARPWIPLRRLTLAEVRAHEPGVIGHVDYTNATGDGTHWDPGPGFPWDVVLARANAIANGEEDDMTPEQDARLIEIREILMRRKPGGVQDIHNIASATLTELRKLSAVVAAGGDVDEKALAVALAPSVIAALAEVKGISDDDVEAAVRRVFADASA